MSAKTASIALHEMFLLADIAQDLGNASLVDCALDSSGRVCVLAVDNVPERIDGMFVQTTTQQEYTYTCLVLEEWGIQRYSLPPQRYNYHFFRMLGDELLLIGARSRRRSADDIEKNAAVFNADTLKKVRSFCLGDGIQDIAVSSEKTIWTSYFDEGVLGNYGWNDPIGSCGVCSWNADGMPLYRFDNSDGIIMDCYAMNVVSDRDVWFYYYSDFKLGCISENDVGFFDVPVSGSSGFAVSGNRVLFRGGYDDRQAFYLCVNKGGRFGKKRNLHLVDGNGAHIKVERFSAVGSAFIVMDGTRIYRSWLDEVSFS